MRLHTGLTNGVLRSVARARDRLPEPDTGNSIRDLAIRWSHPTWLHADMYSVLAGTKPSVFCNAITRHQLTVFACAASRANVQELLDELHSKGAALHASPYLEDYFYVDSLGPLIRQGYMDRGQCAVHDESAGLVVELLNPKPGETYWMRARPPGAKPQPLPAACGAQEN